MVKCLTCGGWVWSLGRHKCWPVWRVWSDGDEDGAVEVRATDAGTAAEIWALDSDMSGDYSIIGGGEEIVLVGDPAGLIQRFLVTGEPIPTYYAAFVKLENGDGL